MTELNECPACHVNGDLVIDQLTKLFVCINIECRVKEYRDESIGDVFSN